MDDLFLAGRLIFGGFFLYSGVHHLTSTASMAQYAASKGLPMPETAIILSGLLILCGGISIVLGLLPRAGVACIALFLVLVTPVMHDFWNSSGPAQMAEMGNFMKNLALFGGALTLLGVPQPWPYSIERRSRIVV